MEFTDKTLPVAELQTGVSIATTPDTNQVVISPTPGTIIPIPENKCADLVDFQPGTGRGQVIDDQFDTSPGQAINNTSGTDPVGDSQRSWKPPPWVQWPLEIRQMIWDACLYEDPDANNPRVIEVALEWNPGDEECNGCPDCPREWDEHACAGFGSYPDDDDEDKEGDEEDEENMEEEEQEEEDEDEEAHLVYYDDHHNFTFLVYDSSQVRRSEEAIASLHLVCKESRERATRFSELKGRAKDNFHSTDLRQLRISPFDDIFHIDCSLVWEVLGEWNHPSLEATLDIKIMERFMLTFRTLYMLANPNDMDRYEGYLEYSEQCCGILDTRFQTSIEYTLANAKDIFVLPAIVRSPKSLIEWESFGAHDDIVEQKAAGLSETEQEIMEDVQQGTHKEFQFPSNVLGRNGRKKHISDVLRVMWVTPKLVDTKQVQAQQAEPKDVKVTQTEPMQVQAKQTATT